MGISRFEQPNLRPLFSFERRIAVLAFVAGDKVERDSSPIGGQLVSEASNEVWVSYSEVTRPHCEFDVAILKYGSGRNPVVPCPPLTPAASICSILWAGLPSPLHDCSVEPRFGMQSELLHVRCFTFRSVQPLKIKVFKELPHGALFDEFSEVAVLRRSGATT